MSAAAAKVPMGERLARVETQVEQLGAATHELHAELREHVAWERKLIERQDARVAALERNAEATRTHLRWMKAVWVAMQGTVFAWVGLK
ncbi:MAG: hypothetical protein NTW87_04230 [Planctomycetota bacterium]|nr:hypothetical protein [Planctomycetota bacterium]